jgi:hypothetical protein
MPVHELCLFLSEIERGDSEAPIFAMPFFPATETKTTRRENTRRSTSSTAKPHSTNARHFTECTNFRSAKRCGEFQRSTVRLWTGSLGLKFRRETFLVDKFPFVCHSFQRMG